MVQKAHRVRLAVTDANGNLMLARVGTLRHKSFWPF